ncbi:MAG: hypothetical protein R6X35_16435 [Candidatus Krumholzibacteriia bacterium]
MKKSTLILVPAVLALALLAGCSGDDHSSAVTSPGGTAGLWTANKSIGPSELVLVLDVSDAVAAADLQAMVDAAGAALADGALVPADGSIAVGAVVYGDTIAWPFAGLVAVTPANLDDVILPALAGLVDDRLVAGAGADLAGAMNAAGLALASGMVADQHLLVMGTGAAADTTGVGDACAALASAGVMISALTLGDGAPLAACAAATGGAFAGMVTDPAAATAEALAYMLQADLELAGSAAELARGAEFAATATFYRGGDPLAYPLVGHDVVFTVIAGPNAGGPFAAVTDSAGHAVLAYRGDGGSGTDTVVADALHPGTGLALSDTVTVAWRNLPPVCDTGGPYAAVVESDTVRIMLDGSASSDADGDSVTFAWSLDCGGATLDDMTSATPTVTLTGACLCTGTLTVRLEVGDGFAVSTCETVIVLEDRRPPVIETRTEPLLLWPPNHKLATYTPDMFLVRAEDACGRPIDQSGVEVLEVRSDEPDDANGDGRTVGDITILCPDTVRLRAERMGGGDGRVYTILYRLTGDNGQTVDFEGTVIVPHDASSGHAGQDPAGGFTVVPDCGGN